MHIAFAIGDGLYVFSAVIAGGGNSACIVGNCVSWINSSANNAQCIAQFAVGDIACAVFEVQTRIGQTGTQVFQLVHIHTVGTVDAWSHFGDGFVASINAVDGHTRATNDGQAILVDGGRAHHDAAGAAQVEVFVQLKVDDIAIAADFDVVFTIGRTNVYGRTWLNLAGCIAIGLDIPTQRGNVLYCIKLAAIDGLSRGIVHRTRVHTF